MGGLPNKCPKLSCVMLSLEGVASAEIRLVDWAGWRLLFLCPKTVLARLKRMTSWNLLQICLNCACSVDKDSVPFLPINNAANPLDRNSSEGMRSTLHCDSTDN